MGNREKNDETFDVDFGFNQTLICSNIKKRISNIYYDIKLHRLLFSCNVKP